MNPWSRVFESLSSEWIDELNERYPQEQPELGLPHVQRGFLPPQTLSWSSASGLLIPLHLENPEFPPLPQSCVILLESAKSPSSPRFIHEEDFCDKFASKLEKNLARQSIRVRTEKGMVWNQGAEFELSSKIQIQPKITVWSSVSLSLKNANITQFWLGVCG